MFRKLLFGAFLSTATLAGMTVTPSTASAQFPGSFDRHDHRHDHCVKYEVLVRHRGHWDHYRTFYDRDDAYRTARMLERRGMDARVERDFQRRR